MKLILALAFFYSSVAHSKFALSVFETPCHKLSIAAVSCTDKIISNKDFTKKKLSNYFNLKGALVKAKILTDTPIKCHAKQKLNLKRFKKLRSKKSHFFINKLSCKEMPQFNNPIKVKYEQRFCDTPGAVFVWPCFVKIISSKFKFIYTEKLED